MIMMEEPRALTERELEIIRLLARGWSNKEIAAELSIPTRTIKFHTANIYSKLRVKRRAEAIV